MADEEEVPEYIAQQRRDLAARAARYAAPEKGVNSGTGPVRYAIPENTPQPPVESLAAIEAREAREKAARQAFLNEYYGASNSRHRSLPQRPAPPATTAGPSRMLPATRRGDIDEAELERARKQ